MKIERRNIINYEERKKYEKSITKSINKKNDNQPLSLNERLQKYLEDCLTKEQKENYKSLIEKYKDDPVSFCEEFWGVKFSNCQKEQLNLIVNWDINGNKKRQKKSKKIKWIKWIK